MLSLAIKILGCGMVIGSSTGLGIIKSKGLSERISDLKELERVVIILENEIFFRRNDLINILDIIINKADSEKYIEFVKRLREGLNNKTGNLQDEVKKALQGIDLDKKIKDIVIDLFSNIGDGGIDGEIKNINLCKKEIGLLENEFIEYQNKYGKLYSGSGGLLGAALALLLM